MPFTIIHQRPQKKGKQNSSRVFVCQIVLDDHGFVVLFFFKLIRFRSKTRAVWEAVKSKLNSQLQKRIRRQRPIECRIVKINGSQMKTWKRRGSGGNHTTNSSCMSVQNPKTRDEILTEKKSNLEPADWCRLIRLPVLDVLEDFGRGLCWACLFEKIWEGGGGGG